MKQVYIRAMKGERGPNMDTYRPIEVQIVVAWSVANRGVHLMALIGSPREKWPPFETASPASVTCIYPFPQLRQLLTTKINIWMGAAKLMRGHLLSIQTPHPALA
jgi:hypothetical protein